MLGIKIKTVKRWLKNWPIWVLWKNRNNIHWKILKIHKNVKKAVYQDWAIKVLIRRITWRKFSKKKMQKWWCKIILVSHTLLRSQNRAQLILIKMEPRKYKSSHLKVEIKEKVRKAVGRWKNRERNQELSKRSIKSQSQNVKITWRFKIKITVHRQ